MPQVSGNAKRLRIYIREDDRWNSEPLYLAIVRKAKDLELAGVSIYRGLIGYKPKSRKGTTKYLMADDMPVLVEIIDTLEYIHKFKTYLADMVREGSIIIDGKDDWGIVYEGRWLIELRWQWRNTCRSA